jgi:hypothetical protein
VERSKSHSRWREAAPYIDLAHRSEDGVVMQVEWGRSSKRRTGLATLARRWNRLQTS